MPEGPEIPWNSQSSQKIDLVITHQLQQLAIEQIFSFLPIFKNCITDNVSFNQKFLFCADIVIFPSCSLNIQQFDQNFC